MEIRDNIIEATSELFNQYGIKSITMDEIASHLSISKKTIYQYFKDKDELVCKVLERDLEFDMEEIERITQNSSNTIEEIYELSKFLRRHVFNLNPSLLFDLKKYHPKAWKVFEDFKSNVFKASIVDLLTRGITEGYFRKDINPEVLALLRMEEVQIPFDNTIFPRDRFDFREVQMEFYDHFIHGIITEKGRIMLEKFSEKALVK